VGEAGSPHEKEPSSGTQGLLFCREARSDDDAQHNLAKSPTFEKPRPHRYRRLLPFLKPARWPFLGGLVAGIVYAVATGAGLPLMMKTVIPVIFEQKSTPPELSPKIIAIAEFFRIENLIQYLDMVALAQKIFGDDYRDKLLLTACIALPLIFLIRGLAAFANRYLLNTVGFIALENLRVAVFARMQNLPLAFYQQHKSGDLMARLINDTEQLRQVIVKTSGEIIKQPLTLVAAGIYLVLLSLVERSVLFTLVAMLSVPLCVIPIRLASKRLRKRSLQLAQANGELTATITESLQAPLEIQAYNLQGQQAKRFGANARNIFRLSLKTVFYQAITSPMIEVVSVCGFVVALYLGVNAGMDFATFSSLAVALYLCYEPVKQLSTLYAHFKIGGASLERLEHILDAADTVPQPAQPVALPAGANEIVFSQVGFTYAGRSADDAPTAALHEVNVRILPGEVVALVGPSGAGKSTFVALLPRFYDVGTGGISLGGVDIRQADKTALRERIALVPQKPALFNTTIGENIRMGRLTATDAEVRMAAQRACIAEFIEKLPQGYDTMIGERGASVSGGQGQRIAIARAFLKDAPILIMDEATSALDSESEADVQAALRQLVQGRTTFIIAHRFSSIALATRILVFENGRITGDGAPEALAQSHAVYRRMVELQKLA